MTDEKSDVLSGYASAWRRGDLSGWSVRIRELAEWREAAGPAQEESIPVPRQLIDLVPLQKNSEEYLRLRLRADVHLYFTVDEIAEVRAVLQQRRANKRQRRRVSALLRSPYLSQQGATWWLTL